MPTQKVNHFMEKAATSTGAKPAHKSDEGSTCLYPSKRCDNPRGVKRNGELHKFCDFHRNKANYNQRRLEHKRKYQQEADDQAASRPTQILLGLHIPPAQQQFDHASALSPMPTLEPDEIWILQELLRVENVSNDSFGDHDQRTS